jgi:hypothetical protein
MRKLIIGLMLIGLLVGGYYIYKPVACWAGNCLSSACYKNGVGNCGSECFCLIPAYETKGQCYQKR